MATGNISIGLIIDGLLWIMDNFSLIRDVLDILCDEFSGHILYFFFWDVFDLIVCDVLNLIELSYCPLNWSLSLPNNSLILRYINLPWDLLNSFNRFIFNDCPFIWDVLNLCLC